MAFQLQPPNPYSMPFMGQPGIPEGGYGNARMRYGMPPQSGAGNSMANATPGPDGQYGMPGGPQSMPNSAPPPTGPGMMWDPNSAAYGGGQGVGLQTGGGYSGGNPQVNGGTTGGQNWGYGNAPGGSTGYYEQQTPVGSFAAANQNRAGSAQGAYNPYIGQGSQMGGAQNPYLGGSAGQATAASNPYAGAGNPYTTQAIDSASQDAIRNYNLFTGPQRDAQAARSGSFGNSGVQQMQLEDQRNLQGTLGNISNSARMQDLFRQQDMGEAGANRQTGVSQFNVGARGGDLNRNLAGRFTGQGLALQGLGLDANLAQGLGMFNAGQGNQMNMFDAGQGNAMNMYNAGAGNNMLENYRNRTQNQGQFDANMNRNMYNDDMGWMRQGQQDQWAGLDRLLGYQGTGIGAANQQRQQPITDWAQFSQVAGNLGGLGGITQQQFEANPWLGAIAGWMMGQPRG